MLIKRRLPFVGIRWLGLNGVRAATVGVCYMTGGFISVFPHKGSNTHMSGMQSNDHYIKSRSHFINNLCCLVFISYFIY